MSPPPVDQYEHEGRLLAAAARFEAKLKTIDDLKDSVDALTEANAERTGAQNVWRGMGAIVGALALALGSAALSLAFEAKGDHERVNVLEQELADVRRESNERAQLDDQRWEQMRSALHQTQTTLAITGEVLVRVERQLDTLEQRRAAPRER